MAEKVQVRGGTLDGSILENAATEATLSRLAAAMEKRGSGSGSKVVEMQERTIKNNISAVSKSSDNLSVFTNTLSNVNTSSKKLGETFARMSSLALGGVLSGIATAGKSLLGFFTNSLESFRETSQVGATFNNDLVELRRTAASAAMPLEMFTQTIAKNSQILAAFGGTVTQGAQRFSSLSKDLRTGDIGTRFMGMGMTMNDLNEYLAEYLDLELKRGRLQGQTDAQLLQGTQNYILEIDKLAKVTGRSRREAAEAMRQNQADARLSVMRRRLTGEAAASFDQSVGLMRASMPTAAFGSLANMMAGVIAPGDQFARVLASADTELPAFMMRVGRGEVGAQEFADRMARLRPRIQAVIDGMGPAAVAAREVYRELESFGMSLENVSAVNTQAAQAEQARRNTITEAMGSFGQTIQKIKDDIMIALIDSGVFTRIQNALTGLARIFLNNSNRLAPAITRIIGSVDEFLTRFLNTIDTRGIGAALFEVFRDLLRGIFSRRETPQQQQARTQRTQRIGEISQERGALEGQLRNTQSADDVGPLQERIRALDAERQRLMQQSTEASQGESSLSGLFNLDWGDLAKSIGLVTAAVIAVGGALSLVSKPAALVFAALGIATGGLGYLFKNLAPLVQTVSDSFGRLPDQLKQFETVDADKLKNLGPALGALTGPLMAAGFAGVLSAVTGNSGLPALANAIRTFEEIDGNKLSTIGGNDGPLRKLYQGLEPFTVQSFGDFIKGIGGALVGSSGFGALANAFATFSIIPTSIGDLKDPLLRLHEGMQPFMTASIGEAFARLLSSDRGIGTLADSIKKFEGVDPASLSAVGPALRTLYEGLSLFTGGSQGGLLAAFSGAIGNFLRGDQGLGRFAESFKKFNDINAGNITNLASGISGLQTTVGEDFARQATNIDTFAGSVRVLTAALNELRQAFLNLNEQRGGTSALSVAGRLSAVGATAAGAAGAGGAATSEMVAEQRRLNTLIAELRPVFEATRDNTKNVADGISGRNNAM